MSENFEHLRLLEALLFASAEPLTARQLGRHFPEDAELETLLEELRALYANRGVNLVRVGDAWAFRTAQDLAPQMRIEQSAVRKLSRAAVETLAIVAYHQPVTRAEIEEIRGVAISKGTLDVLLEAGWIRPRGRRRTPGRPVTWGTTQGFLDHFGLESLEELPGIEELKAAGLLDKRPALTALSARGMLTAVTDAEDTEEPEEEDEIGEDEIDIAVAEDFGADISPFPGLEEVEDAENGDGEEEEAGEEGQEEEGSY
jgi:segregation and condensation protein B